MRRKKLVVNVDKSKLLILKKAGGKIRKRTVKVREQKNRESN